jgi:hypothetical protein
MAPPAIQPIGCGKSSPPQAFSSLPFFPHQLTSSHCDHPQEADELLCAWDTESHGGWEAHNQGVGRLDYLVSTTLRWHLSATYSGEEDFVSSRGGR